MSVRNHPKWSECKTNHLAMVSDRWFGELMVRTEEEGSCRAI